MVTIKKPEFILTDIEGTTSSVSFVTETLFPYFLEHINELSHYAEIPAVREAFDQTVQLAKSEDGEDIHFSEEIIQKLRNWCLEDRKITPLKTLQGVLWDNGYRKGELKGHIYPDVPGKLKTWSENAIRLGVFSSGSVPAQKLIFGYSEAGDLTPYFSAYFDTKTGGKREKETYPKIAELIQVKPENILFLSDVTAELEAADAAGYRTIQLVRPGTEANWKQTVPDFNAISFVNE